MHTKCITDQRIFNCKNGSTFDRFSGSWKYKRDWDALGYFSYKDVKNYGFWIRPSLSSFEATVSGLLEVEEESILGSGLLEKIQTTTQTMAGVTADGTGLMLLAQCYITFSFSITHQE